MVEEVKLELETEGRNCGAVHMATAIQRTTTHNATNARSSTENSQHCIEGAEAADGVVDEFKFELETKA